MTDGQPRLGAELAEVTKGMVSLHRRFYGKGPTEAQRAMERQFTAVIEEALGRKVIAYMSQIHADPDLAVELFMLEPHEADQSEYPRKRRRGVRRTGT